MASATIQIPGYEILRPLGSGGMSTVYLALQRSLDRKVAIKVMRRSGAVLDEARQMEKRFLLEGRMMAKLPHRNIVAVYDIVSNDVIAYIAMEYLSGGSLTERMRSGLSLADAVSVVVQIAAALEFAHSHGVVHRDLKPANIMFRDAATPVLTDFGIARYQDGSVTKLTQTGMLVGTPTYMSPEQINALALDGRSDLYSLGVLFYELLTGAPPFRGETPISVLMAHLTQEAPPLPPELAFFQDILDRMLAKKREERFADMREFSQQLRSRLIQSDTLQMRLHVDPNQSTSEQLRALGFTSSTPGGGLRSPGATPTPAPQPRTEPQAPARRPPLLWIAAAALVLLLAAGAWWYASRHATLSRDEQELVSLWLKQANSLVAANKLVTPPDENAFAYVQKALQKDPQNGAAQGLLAAIADALKTQAEAAVKRGALDEAHDAASQAILVRPDDAALTALNARIEQARKDERLKQQVDALLEQAQRAQAEQRIFEANGAYALLGQARALKADDARIGQRLEALVGEQFAPVRKALQQNQPAAARDALARLEPYLGADAGFAALKTEVDAALRKQQLDRQLADLLDKGGRQLREGHLDQPAGDNAYETLGEIGKAGSGDSRAREFAAALARAFLDEARRLDARGQAERALDRANVALQVDAQLGDAQALKTRIEQRLGERAARIAQAIGAIRQAIAEQRFVPPAPNDAYTALEALRKTDPDNADARQLGIELPQRIADAVAARAPGDLNAASNLLKAAQRVYPQEQALARLAAGLDAQAAKEKQAAQIESARKAVARISADQAHTIDDWRNAIQALDALVGADANDRQVLALRDQLVEALGRQLAAATTVADFDALAKLTDGKERLFRGDAAYAALQKSQPALRARVADAEQARLAAEAGELVLNAYPWGTVEAVLDANRKPVALPADATTPVILTLPAGSYVITFRHPRVDKPAQVIAKVEAKKRVSANATFTSISAQDYFSRAGW